MDRRCQLDGFIVCLHVISITSLCILCLPSYSPSAFSPRTIKLPHSDILAPSFADNAAATSRQNWDCSWKWLIWNRVKIGAVTLSKIRAICCNLSGSSRRWAAACGEEMVFWSLKGGGSGLRWWKRRGCRRLWRTFTCSYWPWEIPRLPTQFLSWKVRVLAYEKGHENSPFTYFSFDKGNLSSPNIRKRSGLSKNCCCSER